MDNEKLYWLYNELKSIVFYTQGMPINIDSETEIYLRIEDILDVTKEKREADKTIDREVREVLNWFVRIVSSAQALNKPL